VALRCIIVDDNVAFLEAARDLLQRQGLTVVGIASTTAEALALSERLRPQLALVDVDLGEENGFDVARALTGARSALKVILVSVYDERDFAELIAASPAVGFLSKSDLSGQAVERVLARDASERRGT
jgi:DNA-binding NarL/FixJ family response regulator